MNKTQLHILNLILDRLDLIEKNHARKCTDMEYMQKEIDAMAEKIDELENEVAELQ